ncbi:MAG: ferrochelatase [Armatimonadota bacterium]
MEILLMAHGAPEELSDLPAYYQHIRGGQPLPEDALARLLGRYEALGGPSPLASITRMQADELQYLLSQKMGPSRVHVGYLHWHPFIEETVEQMGRLGVTQAVALALAPHSCRLGADRYFVRASEAAAKHGIELTPIPQWGDNPAFLDAVASRVKEAMSGLVPDETMVIFSAHSLPARIRSWHDSYEEQVQASADAVAQLCGITDYTVAWQSAARTNEPWIGPSVTEVITEMADEQGINCVVICPIGFVCDHLEVLYDLDMEARSCADDLGLKYRRTASLNASPDFLNALTGLVSNQI